MKKAIRSAVALLTACLLLYTAGCTAGSIDSLLSLPQPSEEYLHLQELINEEIASGSEFSAPTSGSYRQSVQLYDLDADGVDEALVFLRGADQTLKICIYCRMGGDYALVSTIEGEGTAIGSVDFANLNNEGGAELIVAWQVAADLRLLKVYSMTAWSGAVLLTTDCSYFRVYDIAGDGLPRLLNIRFDGAENGYVDMYALGEDNEMEMQSATLSKGMLSVSNLTTGYLSDEAPALFVEGYIGAELYTDIIVYSEEVLKNVSLRRTTGVSVAGRAYSVYCADIDSDRIVEVPFASALYSQSESSSVYWLFNWYSFNSRGRKTLDISTYHCYSEGWYVIVPDELRQNLSVRREDSASGEPTVVLSQANPETGTLADLVQIFTLTGENRHDRARLSGRFILLENDTTIYAAKILNDYFTEEDLISRFRLISTDWNAGIS